MKVMEEFDISKYITTQDVVAAVTAGTIAYLTYKTKQDEPTPEQPQGQAGQPAQADATGLSSTHREIPTTNANQHMVAGFDEEGYMHDCDMMIGNKRVLAVLDKEGNVTSWLDKNGNPFKFANPDQQSRYEYFMKQVAGVNGKQPTFKGSFEEFLAQSNPSGGAAGASVAEPGPIQSAMTQIYNKPKFSGDISIPNSPNSALNGIPFTKLRASNPIREQIMQLALQNDLKGVGIADSAISQSIMDYAKSSGLNYSEVVRLLNTMGTSGLKQLSTSPDKWDLIHTASQLAGIEG